MDAKLFGNLYDFQFRFEGHWRHNVFRPGHQIHNEVKWINHVINTASGFKPTDLCCIYSKSYRPFPESLIKVKKVDTLMQLAKGRTFYQTCYRVYDLMRRLLFWDDPAEDHRKVVNEVIFFLHLSFGRLADAKFIQTVRRS